MDMSLLVKTAGICLYSDFHNGLLKLIRVQKKILLKNMLHKNLPGILDPAVYPSRNLFPQSTSFLGRIWRGTVFALSLRTNLCVLRL